jgi:hypothetical protein
VDIDPDDFYSFTVTPVAGATMRMVGSSSTSAAPQPVFKALPSQFYLGEAPGLIARDLSGSVSACPGSGRISDGVE